MFESDPLDSRVIRLAPGADESRLPIIEIPAKPKQEESGCPSGFMYNENVVITVGLSAPECEIDPRITGRKENISNRITDTRQAFILKGNCL